MKPSVINHGVVGFVNRAKIDRRGGHKTETHAFHPLPGTIVEMKSGGEYTAKVEGRGGRPGQIIRVDKSHLTKKERNKMKKLKRACGLLN